MDGFRLGSVFGFEIRIDLSWFIIFFLILWSFAAGVFPTQYPGLGQATYYAMGIGGALLFFASLLAHELSHSLVARRKGVPVEGITLFIFGGMARTGKEASSPDDELLIAGVGPLSSLAIAAGFWAVAWIGGRAGWPVTVTGVASYLAFLNALLAGFNLLPGFPLDGGRLYRALVWKLTGDMTKATRWATSGGKFLGYLLIAFGLLQAFGGFVLGGLWLVFIGWFLRNAAAMSYRQHVMQLAMQDVRARDLMSVEPETVPEELTLEEAIDAHFLARRYQAFPVLRGDRVVGLLTLEDVKAVPREEWPRRTVGEAMRPAEAGLLVEPDDAMPDVLARMAASGARRALVTRGGRLVGIVSASDVAGWVQRTLELDEVLHTLGASGRQ